MTRSDASVPKSPQLSLVPRLLVSVVAGACRVPRLILVLTAILCVCSLYLALTRLEYQTSRDDLMSADKECQKRWRAFLKEFGRDDDIVVVVKDGQRHEKIAALESIAAHIQKHPQQLDRLFYKIDLRHVRDRALLYLPFDQLELLAEKLTSPKGLQPLLETPYGWQLFSFHFILNEATRRFKSYDDSEPIRAEDAQFCRELLALTRSAHATRQNPNAYRNPWSSLLPEKKSSSNGPSLELLSQPQYFFSDDGKLAFLLVRPLLQEKTFLGAHRQVTLLRGILNEVNREHPSLSMGITGLPVLEADEMAATQQDSKMASWLALAGVTVLYFLVFRTWRWPFLPVSTLVVGAIWTLGWLTLTVGHLNLLSATFAVMLIGMGDYGVLWVARYQQESESLRLSHPHPRDRVKAALRSTAIKVGPSILTASVTTGLAFFATTLADFQGMAELGWIAGCGVLLCAISCFTVLPVLLFLIDGSRKQITDGPVIIPMPQRPPEPTLKRSLGILTVGVLLSICLGIFSLRITYDQNLLNLQAKGLKSVHWEETLLRHTSAASWHALSYASTRKEALQLKARFEKVPEVSHVVEVASLLPGDAKEQRRKLLLLQTIQEQLRSLPPRGKPIPTLLKRESIPHDQIRAIEEHCSRWKGQKLFHDLGAALKRFRANVSELSGTESASRFKTFQRSMVRDLAEGLHQLRAMSSPKLIELSEIPESLRQRYVSPQGSWLSGRTVR